MKEIYEYEHKIKSASLKNYLKQKKIRLEDITNYARKHFAHKLNNLIWFMAYVCETEGNITKKQVKEFLIKNYFMSEIAVRRYTKTIITLEIFIYDKKNKMFIFSKELIEQMLNNLK